METLTFAGEVFDKQHFRIFWKFFFGWKVELKKLLLQNSRIFYSNVEKKKRKLPEKTSSLKEKRNKHFFQKKERFFESEISKKKEKLLMSNFQREDKNKFLKEI